MTVASQTSRVSYSGDGSSTEFAVPFYFLADSHLRVVLLSAAGVETEQTLGADYTVTGAGESAGGEITMSVAPDTGETLTILRNVPFTQQTDYQANDPFPAESHERALDKLTMVAQQSQEQLDRVVVAPVSEAGSNLQLPSISVRSGKYLAFNESTGDPEAGPSVSDVDTVSGLSADIALLADIEDGTIATNAITTVSGISSNVTTVANISSDVTAVVADQADIGIVAADLDGSDTIGTVAANISDVSAVAAIDSDVSAVANNATDIGTVATDLAGSDTIGTVATNISNVNTLATNISSINSVAENEANINAVVADEVDIGAVAGALTNINTVATNVSSVAAVGSDLTGLPITVDYGDLGAASNPATPSGAIGAVYSIADEINTVAEIQTETASVAGVATDVSTVSGISANVTTVAGISTNVTSLASISSDVSSVAAIESDISAVAAIDSDVTTVATNVADITNFADVYQGPKASDPTLRNDGSALQAGDLYFNTVSDEIRVYTGSAWVAGITNVNNLLLASNNLSDLTNAQDARDNLGISDMGVL